MAKPLANRRRKTDGSRAWRCVNPTEVLALSKAYATWDEAMLAVEDAEERSWFQGWIVMPEAAWQAFMANQPDEPDDFDDNAWERWELQREWVHRARGGLR